MPGNPARTHGRRRGLRPHGCALCAAALAAAGLASVSFGAPRAEVSWRDLEGRIQYSCYTEDAPALRSLAETVALDESRDRLHGYYAGLVAWRLAQLAAQGAGAVRGASAAHLARRCVGELDATLAAATDFAEGLALRAACLATEADTAQAGHAARGARRDIDRALRLAARNPRVLLIDAMSDYQLAPERGGDKERALAKLRRAVAAFELERAGTEQLPGWDAAGDGQECAVGTTAHRPHSARSRHGSRTSSVDHRRGRAARRAARGRRVARGLRAGGAARAHGRGAADRRHGGERLGARCDRL